MNHPEEFTKTTPNHIVKWVLKESIFTNSLLDSNQSLTILEKQILFHYIFAQISPQKYCDRPAELKRLIKRNRHHLAR